MARTLGDFSPSRPTGFLWVIPLRAFGVTLRLPTIISGDVGGGQTAMVPREAVEKKTGDIAGSFAWLAARAAPDMTG